MPNNVSNVSFGQDQSKLMEIDRQKALAQALSGQAMEPIQNQMSGGWAVPISPWQGLAKLAQAGVGGMAENKAQALAKALGEQQQQRRGADMSLLAQALGGRQASPGGLQEDASGNVTQMDPMAAQSPMQSIGQALPMIQDPQMQQMGMQALMAQMPKKPEPFTLKKDEMRYGADNQPIAFGMPTPEKPERRPDFTIGNVRYSGETNQPLVTGPDKPEPQPRVPPGYRMTPEGNMEAVPGGPADLKMQGAFNQDTANLNGSTSSMDRLAIAANELMRHPGLGGITGKRGAFPNIPGGDAANAQAKLDTLKSQVGFGVLQDMRNNSRTGGALGSVSDAEGKRLEANLASLANAQSADAMKESLQNIIDYTAGAKVRLQQAFNMKHQPKQPQRRSSDLDALLDQYAPK